ENHFDNETSQTMAFIAQMRQSKGLQAHDPVLIDAQDHRGFTALMLATMRGNTAAVQALLTQQANVNALLVSSWQFTFPPCSEASDSAEAERPLRPASNDAKNRSVLMLAAEHGQAMAARL